MIKKKTLIQNLILLQIALIPLNLIPIHHTNKNISKFLNKIKAMTIVLQVRFLARIIIGRNTTRKPNRIQNIKCLKNSIKIIKNIHNINMRIIQNLLKKNTNHMKKGENRQKNHKVRVTYQIFNIF